MSAQASWQSRLKIANSEMMETKLFIGKNGVLFRIGDGSPIFPIVCFKITDFAGATLATGYFKARGAGFAG